MAVHRRGRGPDQYEPVDVGERRILACGGWSLSADHDREQGDVSGCSGARITVPEHAELGIEVMARDRADAERLLSELDRLMTELNVYRGRILALSGSPFGGMGVEVRAYPRVLREQIVFPDGVLERIERHTKTVAEHAEALRASGRHLKRGLLLHGPPGTGKTLTAMYLSHLMPDRTVLLLTGAALHAIGPACKMARDLAPSMLVLEDVDLVAEDREYGHSTSVLFELLNEMDGLGEDTDIVFVLTTNRPEVINRHSRPGPAESTSLSRCPCRTWTGAGGCSICMARGSTSTCTTSLSSSRRPKAPRPPSSARVLRRAALQAAERGNPRISDQLIANAIDELNDTTSELTKRRQASSRNRPAPPSSAAEQARGTGGSLLPTDALRRPAVAPRTPEYCLATAVHEPMLNAYAARASPPIQPGEAAADTEAPGRLLRSTRAGNKEAESRAAGHRSSSERMRGRAAAPAQ